jgi:hypothetical protein
VTVAQIVGYRRETEPDQSLGLRAYEHGPDWQKLLEEETMHVNSPTGDRI